VTPAEASAALEELWNRRDPLVVQLQEIIEGAMVGKPIPILMRCSAVVSMMGACADGLAALEPETIAKVHRVDLLPDLILALRATADLFEEANRLKTH
jgi:hypothetical protein